MDKVAGGVAGIGLGAYLIAVAVNGNGPKLVNLLKDDRGYLEFLAALYAVYLLHKSKIAGEFTNQLLIAGGIAAVIAWVRANPSAFDELQKFGAGQQSLFTSLGNMFSK